jgi:hypothetical protein
VMRHRYCVKRIDSYLGNELQENMATPKETTPLSGTETTSAIEDAQKYYCE